MDVISNFQSCLITGLDRLLGLQEVGAPRVFRQSAHEVGKIFRPTHLPPLHSPPPSPPGDTPGSHFCYRRKRTVRTAVLSMTLIILTKMGLTAFTFILTSSHFSRVFLSAKNKRFCGMYFICSIYQVTFINKKTVLR